MGKPPQLGENSPFFSSPRGAGEPARHGALHTSFGAARVATRERCFPLFSRSAQPKVNFMPSEPRKTTFGAPDARKTTFGVFSPDRGCFPPDRGCFRRSRAKSCLRHRYFQLSRRKTQISGCFLLFTYFLTIAQEICEWKAKNGCFQYKNPNVFMKTAVRFTSDDSNELIRRARELT